MTSQSKGAFPATLYVMKFAIQFCTVVFCWLLLVAYLQQLPTAPLPQAVIVATPTTVFLNQSAELSLGSLAFADIVASDRTQFSAEIFNLHYFDARQAILFPAGAQAMVAFPPTAIKEAARWSLLYAWGQPMGSLGDYSFFQRVPETVEPFAAFIEYKINKVFMAAPDQQVLLRGSSVAVVNGGLQISTIWEQVGEPTPINFQLALVDQTGEMLAQWRGIGVEWAEWQRGDIVLQLSELSLLPHLTGSLDLQISLVPDQAGATWLVDAEAESVSVVIVLP